MMLFSRYIPSLLLLFHLSVAVPLSLRPKAEGAEATTPLPNEQVNAMFLRPALFARAAYCSSASVANWTCGPQCDALGEGVEVLLAAGDDQLIPEFFVVHDSQTQSIVVAHQGTNSDNIISILNNLPVALVELNPARVPNQPSGVRVHEGFQSTFERTADQILATVQKGLADKQVKKVLVVGHSLGAAIGILDTLMLKAALPADTQITTTVFGLPRVGNAEFASFVTSTLGSSFSFVTNGKDLVPNLPPKLLGYEHSEREFHIVKAGLQPGDIEEVVDCVVAENQACGAGTNLLEVEFSDHSGPYIDGIGFGGKFCPA